MKAEPLNIRDKRFLINRLIEQAPVSTLVREFFKNADESAVLAETGNRRIEIYPTTIDGVRKLTFWNTGVGMDDRELKQATDLSSSINKEMALDGNFGIGAKVSGLTMSREGIRYRSCKSGIVNEVTIGFDADEGTYVRFPVELPDGSSDTVYDVTDVAREAGQDTAFDWTSKRRSRHRSRAAGQREKSGPKLHSVGDLPAFCAFWRGSRSSRRCRHDQRRWQRRDRSYASIENAGRCGRRVAQP